MKGYSLDIYLGLKPFTTQGGDAIEHFEGYSLGLKQSISVYCTLVQIKPKSKNCMCNFVCMLCVMCMVNLMAVAFKDIHIKRYLLLHDEAVAS